MKNTVRRTSKYHAFILKDLNKRKKALIGFSVVMAFIFMGDSIMSYLAPVVIERHTSSRFLMGLIISSSSVIGLICDLFLPKMFPDKKYDFFTIWTGLIALIFPLVFIFLPAHIWAYLLAMAAWGIYYELARFSQYSFVHTFLHRDEHASAWGVMEIARSLALTIGPIIASLLLMKSEIQASTAALISFIVALIGFFIVNELYNHRKVDPVTKNNHRSLKQEVKIWVTLMKKIWHLYFYLFSVMMLDTAFWTVGILLAEQLKQTNFLGNFLIPAYVFPSMFMSLLAGKLARKHSKKKIAFLSSLIGASMLLFGLLFIKSSLLILVIFLSSFFITLSFPETYAVFEDYVARLKDFGHDMVGLESSAISLAYIVGPILAGLLATFLSLQNTIAVFAAILVLMSGVSLFIVPKKIKMPQKTLNGECNDCKI